MKPRAKASLSTLAAAIALAALCLAPAGAGAVTIGPDINHSANGQGSCSGAGNPLNRPCTVINLAGGGRQVTSPCNGRVVRFRLNGVPTDNTYRLRVVRDNLNGSYTGTATSSPAVSIQFDGVNTYATNLAIKKGNYLGIDFQDSTEFGLRYFFGSGFQERYFYTFPPDGTPDFPTGTEGSSYLFNADITCGTKQKPKKCKGHKGGGKKGPGKKGKCHKKK